MGYRDDYKQVRDDAEWTLRHGARDVRTGVFGVFFKIVLPISLVLGGVSYFLWWPAQPPAC